MDVVGSTNDRPKKDHHAAPNCIAVSIFPVQPFLDVTNPGRNTNTMRRVDSAVQFTRLEQFVIQFSRDSGVA